MQKSGFVYCRISQDRTGAGLGVERQETDCRQLAESLGIDVLKVFVDNDLSAYSGKARPAYLEMLDALRDGQAQSVICWHTDRLHRSPVELESYIDVSEKRKVTTYAVQAGEIDLSTPSGRAVARTLGAWARYESEHKSERLKRAKQQAKEKGRWTGGPAPYGWKIVDGFGVIDEEQANAIRLAAKLVLMGATFYSVIQEFEYRGIKTARGADRWNHVSLRDVLLRPKLAGLREVDGELVNDPGFPAILPEEEWLGLRAVVSNPGRRTSFDNRNKYLLTGIAECVCGSTMKVGARTDHRGKRRPIYRCKVLGQGHVQRLVEYSDALVSATMEAMLEAQDAKAFTAAAVEPNPSYAAEANALRARLSEAAVMAADGVISMTQLGQMTERLRGKLEELENAAAEAAIAATEGSFDAAKEWGEASLEQRRKLLQRLVRIEFLRVGNTKGPAFDPESIRITPKW
ncbi:recombinase family protein [Arthrobacter sp. ISL-95]|uniref:recombinase family protein n=1 Tax=Arthrobacter sp. ISL-95 TaxID=2819116 RepID=UPI001BE9CA4E|nr:recombinase family protein [Arthrobacter sp. ISL-95]MBT2587991.1 recombinase family protein [Arthrobacter sp. ISL-95]